MTRATLNAQRATNGSLLFSIQVAVNDRALYSFVIVFRGGTAGAIWLSMKA
jgi:hypothetical protein